MIRVWDAILSSPKQKRHICVSPERRLFLRINSQPFWPPHHLLLSEANPNIIDYDSYVELRQLCRIGTADLEQAMRQADNPLGRMEASEARELAWAASRAVTLPNEHQRLVWERLTENYDD